MSPTRRQHPFRLVRLGGAHGLTNDTFGEYLEDEVSGSYFEE